MEEKSINSSTAYVPTKIEEKLLEVLLEPQNRMKKVVDICGLVPCDPKTYYKAFKKPGFIALYKEMSLDLVKSNIMPVIHAVLTEAKRGSYNHSKMVLEMAGIYEEKQKVESNNINTNHNIDYSTLPNEALEEIAKAQSNDEVMQIISKYRK